MTTLPSVYTYADWAKEHDQNGKPVRVINMLSRKSPLLRTALIMEGNLPLGHKTELLTGLPDAIVKRFGKGIPTSKGTTTEVTFECSAFATRSQIDKALAELGGVDKVSAARMKRSERFMEAITRKYENQMFYGANGDEAFPGLAAYYGSLSGSNASENVISAGGSAGDQTSAFLVNWGPDQVSQFYPAGTPAGIDHIDVGDGKWVNVQDDNGDGMLVYIDEWTLWAGLAVEDWRHAARVCNLDVSDLNAATTGYYDTVLRAMNKAHYRIPEIGPNARWYVPRFMAEQFHNIAVAKSAGNLSVDTFDGKPITKFIGVPIEISDNILVTETAVS